MPTTADIVSGLRHVEILKQIIIEIWSFLFLILFARYICATPKSSYEKLCVFMIILPRARIR